MKRTLAAVALALVLGAGPVLADAVQLQVNKTATPGEVRLTWSGGIPTYTVYRSAVAATISDPINNMGTTSSLEWLDPAPGSIAFFHVASPCTAAPPAVCCLNDGNCLFSEYCDGGTSVCTPKKAQGSGCAGPNECNSNFCVDDVCCSSPCNGTCSACDIAGPPGTCGPAPNGTDPDAECPAVSCLGYYAGFLGDACRRKADVSAAQATCNGTGACGTTAEECTAQSTAGPVTITCHPTCQDPTPGTCVNTVPGACTNVNPGNQTCGTGACANTVPQCAGGAPNSCVPGSPSPETCNNIDDNCNGTVDDNPAFTDGQEFNDTCSAYRTLNAVGENQTQTYNTVTVYPSGDVDIYRINANETGSGCACCDGGFCLDEDFKLTVTLTVPAGAGSYELCMSTNTTSCGAWPGCVTIPAGTSNSLVLTLDGACISPDNYSAFVRVRGIASPGFKCSPYTLSYGFITGCF